VAGHATGDQVIVEIARRLSDSVRPADTVGRLSGDEFVIICPGVTMPAAQAIAQRIGDRVGAPIRTRNREHRLGVSIGIALSTGADIPSALVEQADAAMYLKKSAKLLPTR
jgi:diguanylate cyclase (GGDEF)-like protein